MKTFLAAIVLYVISIASVSAQTPVKTIPDFTFFTFNKTPFTKTNVVPGRPSLFVFFDVTCDHCQNTMKLLSTNVSALKKAGVYLVSLDREDAIKNFMNRFGKGLMEQKNVILLQDLKYQFIPRFRPDKYPSVFLFNANRDRLFYSSDESQVPRVFTLLK